MNTSSDTTDTTGTTEGTSRAASPGGPDGTSGGSPDAAAGASGDGGADAAIPASPKSARPDGPWDVTEVEDAAAGRIGLGGLWLPAKQGAQLRVDVDKAKQRVIAVTLALKDSALQLQAFAAPRSEGVWGPIRTEIRAGILNQGGPAEERPGAFGPELHARLPVQLPDGRKGVQPMRFVGIDGPRWFLRAVFTGRAALDASAAADLEEVLRGVVVVRGEGAMPPRAPITLTLPPRPDGAAAGEDPISQAASESAPQPDLNPFARGPEITETR